MLIFVWGIFPKQIHLFKMHIFIHLPSVHLNTGVKSEIIFLPELEHNSVCVKNRKHCIVNYRVKISSLESKWQNFQCYGYMASKCGNTLWNYHLMHWFPSHTESDSSFVFGWVLFLLKSGSLLWSGHFPIIAAYNGQWLTGQKITDHFIWGLLLAFQQGKNRSSGLLPIHSLVLHTCKAMGAAVYHPINPILLKGFSFCTGRLPLLQCLCSTAT